MEAIGPQGWEFMSSCTVQEGLKFGITTNYEICEYVRTIPYILNNRDQCSSRKQANRHYLVIFKT
jgi:hypothetical protein